MKIRIMGTSEECVAAQAFYRELGNEPGVKFCTSFFASTNVVIV